MPGAKAQLGAHGEPGLRKPAPRGTQGQGGSAGRPGSEPECGTGRRGEGQERRGQQTEKTLSSPPLHLKQPGKINIRIVWIKALSLFLLQRFTFHVLIVSFGLIPHIVLRNTVIFLVLHAVQFYLCQMLCACCFHFHLLLLYIHFSSTLFLPPSPLSPQ